MGGTFPAFIKGYLRSAPRMGADLALLYALNTIGGAAGCLLAGFLLPSIPMSLTVYIAAGFNIALGITFIVLAPRFEKRAPEERAEAEATSLVADLGPNGRGIVIGILFLTGFLSLSYEILWTRVLTQIVLASYFSFSMILSSMLIGITLGSALYRMILHRRDPTRLLLVLSLLLLAVSAASFLAVFGLVDLMLVSRGWTPFPDPALNLMIRRFVLCFAAFLPSSILFGAIFPLCLRLYAESSGRLGTDMGRAYGVNTLGSVVGVLLTGVVLIGWLGSGGALILLLVLNAAVAALAARLLPQRILDGVWGRAVIPVFLGLAVLVVLVFPRGLFFEHQIAVLRQSIPGARRVLFQGEDATSIATVVDIEGGPFLYAEDGVLKRGSRREIFHSNRLRVGGTQIYSWNVTSAYLSTLLHPRPENVLIIGYGSGRQLASLVDLPYPKRIDVVEISRVNIDASDFFYLDSAETFSDPRVQLYLDDGRNHLLRTKRLYDVILVDVGGLGGDGREFLYTREFIQLCKDHLRNGGLFFSWLHYSRLMGPIGWMYQNTFHSVFPDSSIWFGTRTGEVHSYPWLMGVRGDFAIDYPLLRKRWENLDDSQRMELSQSGIRSPEDLLSLYAGSLGQDIPERIASARLLTDDQPPLWKPWEDGSLLLKGLIDESFLRDPSIYAASFARFLDEAAFPPVTGLSNSQLASYQESRNEVVNRARKALLEVAGATLAQALRRKIISREALVEYVSGVAGTSGADDSRVAENLVAEQARRLLRTGRQDVQRNSDRSE
jgi:spermidine synthase